MKSNKSKANDSEEISITETQEVISDKEPEQFFNELDPRFLSVSAINSLVNTTSPSRAVMDAKHTASAIVLEESDPNILISGIEYELGKHLDDVRTDEDCVVKGSIRKLPNDLINNPETAIFVEFEKDGKLWLDLIIVKGYRARHSYFGHPLKPTETMENLRHGAVLQKDTILATSTALAEDGYSKFGRVLNVAMLPDPATAEDGFVVSESCLEKFKFTSITTRVFHLTRDSIPVNTFGDENEFKFIPDIGEVLGQDALLGATRPRDDYYSPVDLSNNNISKPDYIFDDCEYVSKESKVIDIKVIKGSNTKIVYSESITSQLEKYWRIEVAYANNIINQYNAIVKGYRQHFGQGFTPERTSRMDAMLSDFMITRELDTAKRKVKHSNVPIDQYRVEVTLQTTVKPNKGFKLSDLMAAKGVICDIRPDNKMPFDEFGNRADIIAGGMSETISRMNIGRVYAMYFGAYTRDNKKRFIIRMLKKYGQNFINKMQESDYIELISELDVLMSLVNPELKGVFNSLPMELMEDHVNEIIEEEIRLYYPTNNQKKVLDVIEDIENSTIAPDYGKVSYYDAYDNLITLNSNARIGRMYFMLLDRTGRDFSAVSSAKVNNFMIPVKVGDEGRNRHPHNQSPVTNLSETETRFIAGLAPSEFIAEFYDLALNPISHKHLIRHIFEGEKLYDTEFDFDRTKIPYGGSKPLEMLKHLFYAYGLEFSYTNDNPINELDLDGVTHE